MTQTYLFVPADSQKLIARAHERGADVLILDLEDSIPAGLKPAARETLPTAIKSLKARGCKVAVRVNSDVISLALDVQALASEKPDAIMIPKARSVGQMAWIVEALALHDLSDIEVIALIETPEGVAAAKDIAAVNGVTALAFGPEDFSTSCGHEPTTTALLAPAQTLIWAARASGKKAIVSPDSLAVIKDEDRFTSSARLAKQIGSDGVLCIHPVQVKLAKEAFAPTEAERKAAEIIVSAFESAAQSGSGVLKIDGEMVDLPVVERARAVLNFSEPQKTLT